MIFTFSSSFYGSTLPQMESAIIMSRNNLVDLWEAWVDLQVIGNKQLITLYVLGEVSSVKGSLPALVKRTSKFKTKVLSLDLLNADEDDKSIEELCYYEILNDINQYETVQIFNNGQLIASINIELVN